MGRYTGRQIQQWIIAGSSGPLVAWFSLSFYYVQVLRSLGGGEVTDRIEGYYGLYGLGVVEPEYIIERFFAEQEIAAKGTLLWMLRYSDIEWQNIYDTMLERASDEERVLIMRYREYHTVDTPPALDNRL